MFSGKEIIIEEEFIKNKVSCSFASYDNICTLGFTETEQTRPKSLMKGNRLHQNKCINIELIMRKKVDELRFSKIVFLKNTIVLNQLPIAVIKLIDL